MNTSIAPTHPNRNDMRLQEYENQLYTLAVPSKSAGVWSPSIVGQPNPYRQAAQGNMGSLQEMHLTSPTVAGGNSTIASRVWPSNGLVQTQHAELVALFAEQKQLILSHVSATPVQALTRRQQPSATAALPAAILRIELLERDVKALHLIIRQLQERAGLHTA